MTKQNAVRSVLAAELVLLVPLVAMLFTEEVDWNAFDFFVASILLAGIGFASHLIFNGVKSNKRQAVIGIVLAVLMMLIWIELAVGLFTNLGS